MVSRSEVFFKLHQHALGEGDFELALSFAEKALEGDSSNYEYAIAVMKCRLNQKQPPHITRVMKDVETAFLTDPTQREPYEFIVPLTFQSKLPEFRMWIERALVAFPDDELFLNIAGAAEVSTNPKKARTYFQKCLALNPTKAEHHYNCGLTYTHDTTYLDDADDKSVWHFQMALCYNPGWIDAKQALVGAYTRHSKFKEALAIESNGDIVIDALQLESKWRSGATTDVDYDELISRASENTTVLGSILKNQTGYYEAIEDYEMAEKAYRYIYNNRGKYFEPETFMYKDIALGVGQFLMKQGNWDEGAPMMSEYIITEHDHGFPMWDGKETDHLVILNYGLGNGDQMFYSRYIPLAGAKAKRTTIVVAPRLKHMYSNVTGYEVTTEIPKEATCWIEASYLLVYFGPQPMWDYLPAPTPGPKTGKGLIQLCKSGNPLLTYRRHTPFDAIKPLLDLPNLKWVSVEKHECEHPNLTDLSDTLDKGPDGFIDTMKVLAEVDVVVTGCTAIAHLAGLMKRPTLLILSTMCEFRWGSKVYSYQWYPTMKYIRQKKWGSWDGIDDQLIAALNELV